MRFGVTILSLFIGFVFLLTGSKILCDSGVHIAQKFKISSVIVGVFIISFGTAAPDLMAALIALIEGHSNISIGNILGSNFANFTLGLGVGAIIAPFECDKKLLKIEFPLLLIVTVLFILFCYNGKLSRLEGIVFLVIFAIYLSYSIFFRGEQTKAPMLETCQKHGNLFSIKKAVFLFALSAIILAAGAHLVVISCCKIADLLKISQTFIGFSLLAFGTSAPEIFVVATAAKNRQHSICSGNIIGSNLINLMLITGICALVRPMKIERNVFVAEAISLVAITCLTWFVFKTMKHFSRILGIIFVLIYLIVMLAINKN